MLLKLSRKFHVAITTHVKNDMEDDEAINKQNQCMLIIYFKFQITRCYKREFGIIGCLLIEFRMLTIENESNNRPMFLKTN